MVSKATFRVAIRLHLKLGVQRYIFQSEAFVYRIILDAYLNPRDSSFSNGDFMGFTMEKHTEKFELNGLAMVWMMHGNRKQSTMLQNQCEAHDGKINE